MLMSAKMYYLQNECIHLGGPRFPSGRLSVLMTTVTVIAASVRIVTKVAAYPNGPFPASVGEYTFDSLG